ncbi:hypothetical protein IFM89_007864 [Coptis chinensis]|uniref:BAHD acyltransferase n=1 Tax=Coptis chinensis TaxID=261450 RepID=A0A835LBD3_9MAGN|nr:hypothetical protein IFM89_007864 [Coptis chinensis]
MGSKMPLIVEVISKETIKPSSPTPLHLRTFKLSRIDQYAFPVYVPLVLFYSTNKGSNKGEYDVKEDKRLDHLKKSLSEILTHFYILGGRIDGNQFIDCNDEGVNFFEARVNGKVSEMLNHPIPEELNKLLPKENNLYGLGPKVLLSIQVNIFNCGGMAVGVLIAHKAADASSLGLFLNQWAAITRKEDSEILPSELDLASLFPPNKDELQFTPSNGSSTKKVATKRFVFNASNIAALKAKSSNNLYVKHPTRVEAVSALIWRCAMNVLKMRPEFVNSVSVAIHTVNLRGRMVPPLSNLFFGNVMTYAMTTLKIESPPELHCLVNQFRKALRKIDGDHARKLQVDHYGHFALGNYFKGATEKFVRRELVPFFFTSWCRFPFYEADFGWEKPIWISTVNLVTQNLITLMDTKCGIGIEAWVALDEEDMDRFECEPDIIAFTTASGGAY